MISKSPLPPLWMSLWVPLLAVAWLIPNHYYPWATFHTDAWVAVMLAVAAAAVIVRSATPTGWHGLTIVIGLLATVPFMQFAAGMLPFSGQAWLSTTYVLGLLLALLVGARWEALTPGRAADGLFLAIGLACLISVGLQLHEWLGLVWDFDPMQIWMAEFSPGRPAANLGQPNQLATLMVWALLCCAWGIVRQKIRPIFAIAAALIILFGIALTQSRIALIALVAITLAAWIWRRLLPTRVPWLLTLLMLYFFVCTFSLQYLSDMLGLDVQIRSASLGGGSTMLRIKAYRLFLDAVWQQPWWGYGWNQLALAQLSVAERHPTLTAFFMHSHNLFLDIVLWCGIPIGAALSLFLLDWWIRCARRVSNIEDAILVLFVLVVGLHAMVELPLHHAYLLLPTGLVMGMLNQRMHFRVLWTSSRWVVLGLWLASSILLGAIIWDYLRIDESFRTYRLESSRIGRLPPGKPPEVLLLNDLQAFIRNARMDVKPTISTAELAQLHVIAVTFPTPVNLFNYAKALAFLHEPDAATLWIKKMQKVQPRGFDRDLRIIWESQSRTQPAMAAVKWPPLEPKEEEPMAPKASKN